jgi:hypothetical protein
MADLRLSGVPALTFVGLALPGTVVTNSGKVEHVWKLDEKVGGLTILPSSGTLAANATQAVTITPISVGTFQVDLIEDTKSPVTAGSANTVAYEAPPALQRYYELLADLETLKF